MRYPAYPAYRTTGISFLEQVPEPWAVKRLRFVTASIEQGWSPQCDNNIADDDAWGVMKVGCVNGHQFDPLENKALPADLEPQPEYELRPGDVLISRANTRDLVGSAAVVPHDVRPKLMLCDKLFRLRPEPQIDERYLTYFLRTPAARYQYEKDATGASGSMQNIGQNTIKNLVLPLPPRDEQQHIAAFLDWKTSQIDALIARKQALIEKLKEKRLAVITRAVTKGLYSAVPMRDSGVQWLGAIPAHWKVPALKMRYTVELGKMLDEKRISGSHLLPYLRNVDVQWDRINLDDLPEMDIYDNEIPRYTVRTNDVLVCEGGEVGRAAIVGPLSNVTAYQKALHRLRADMDIEMPKFIYYTLVWAAGTGAFSAEGASTISHLTADQLRQYRFPQPPVAEQAAISAFLDEAVTRTDQLLHSADSVVTRLTEYRTALITAAVTGQIDVRGVDVPQSIHGIGMHTEPAAVKLAVAAA